MAFKEYNRSNLPVAEKIHYEVLSIPMSSAISIEDQEYFIE